MKRYFYLICFFFLSVFNATNVTAKEKIVVFAASSLTAMLEDVATQYKKAHPETEILFSFASSSTLAKQIAQGAEADLFISAHPSWMTYLQEQHAVNTSSIRPLISNVLALITYPDSPLTKNKMDINTLKSLNWATILKNDKMVIGDPKHVPAGIYAKESLQNLGLYDTLSPYFVFANSVKNAVRFVEQKEALAGIVYSSDAINNDKVQIILEFAQNLHSPIYYHLAEVKQNSPENVTDFANYLYSDDAKKIFSNYGLKILL